MRSAIIFSLFLILFFLSACTEINYVHPLSQPGEEPNDERLAGVWYLDDDGHHNYLHISKDQKGWLDVILIGHNKSGESGELNAMLCEMFTSTVPPYRFMNIRNCRMRDRDRPKALDEVKPDDEKYWIFGYEITEAGELMFKGFKTSAITQGVESGELAGTKINEQSVITITADSASLQKFIQQADPAKLFEDIPPRLIKIKPPSPSSSKPE